MRALLAILTLALAATASLPSTHAVQDPAVCIPPGTLNQACVGIVNGEPCAWPNGASPFGRICVSPSEALPAAICVPPASLNGACVGIVGDAACAWVYGGPAYHYACVHADGRIEACSTNLFAALYGDGFHCLGDPMP
ncbi:MAG: hypothetical protein QOD77_142 [Thermoplasmata archaeon]|jgi:hypothetical protein|nr:hypothetical protein [Thermoplasmata archaeon]